MSRRADLLIDVTSLISAEEFLLAINRRSASEDPFARQCFVEIIQSLILMSRLYVAHPVLLSPVAEDFGERPLLLRSLVRAGLLHPLHIDVPAAQLTRQLEDDAVRDLNGGHGLDSFTWFIRQTSNIDQMNSGGQPALLARIRDWSEFQKREVHNVSGHHAVRIPTHDGVEDDPFGEWARAAAVVLRSAIDQIAAPGEGRYLTSLLVRTMKYRARAEATGISYQSHPLRRDFSLTFDMIDSVASVASAATGVPIVSGMWFTARSLGKQFARPGAQPYQTDGVSANGSVRE